MNKVIKLYLDLRQSMKDFDSQDMAWTEGADALVIDPCECAPEQFEAVPVAICNGEPERDAPWRERAGHWVCEGDLEAAARLQDNYPALHWVPRLSVFRSQVSYRFSGPAIGEGFSFYMPDTSAIKEWRVSGSERSLRQNLARAIALGFDQLWLHSPDAASRGKGLDLDLLDITQEGPWAIWLSGGVSGSGHLRSLQRVGGASTVVVETALARQYSMATLREALSAKTPSSQAVPAPNLPREAELGPH